MVTPTANTGIYPDGTSSCVEGWYILVTGAAPSAQCAKIDIYLTGEFIPTAATLPLSVCEKANFGI